MRINDNIIFRSVNVEVQIFYHIVAQLGLERWVPRIKVDVCFVDTLREVQEAGRAQPT